MMAVVDSDARQRLSNRLHLIEGLREAVDRWAEISDLMYVSKDRVEARLALSRPPFSFSEIQAQHVLDMRMVQRTALGRRALLGERDRLLIGIDALDETDA